MDPQLETLIPDYQYLNESYFQTLYHAFIAAFSEYVMPFDLSEVQFRNHIVLNAIDLERSIGCFENGQIVGFTLNGFGKWNGFETVYDAGTGVLPMHRQRGIGRSMFETMLPKWEQCKIKQYLLEVAVNNEKAVGLYQKLGFERKRELSLLECPGEMQLSDTSTAFELRDFDQVNWGLLRSFWDCVPSWQNSPDAIDRSRDKKQFIGAFEDTRCIGYIVYSKNVGRVAQLAVDRHYRGRGVASLMLTFMAQDTESDGPFSVINVDSSDTKTLEFDAKRGFSEKLRQFEILRAI